MDRTTDQQTSRTATEPSRDSSRGMKEAGRRAAHEVREQARSRLEQGRDSASVAAADAADALDDSASTLAQEGHETLARAASTLSDNAARLADRLESRSVDELAKDARRLARENPGAFVAGGIALGMMLGRFFKAAPPDDFHDEPDGEFERPARSGSLGSAGGTP